jgi:hypothetical protein
MILKNNSSMCGSDDVLKHCALDTRMHGLWRLWSPMGKMTGYQTGSRQMGGMGGERHRLLGSDRRGK